MNNEIINQEEELVLLLSQPCLSTEQAEKFKYLLESYLNWDKVIGMIELHRIAGLAWKNIQEYFFNNDSNRCTCNRLYKYLYNSYKINTLRASEQLNYTYDICRILEKNNIKYVLLKGIIISSGLYGDSGLRDFNDNDILIHPKDIDAATSLILNLGYIQGESKHLTKIKKPTRKEKIIRSLTSHEVIPFIKNLSSETNISAQHIVDLHFSVNLMSGKRTDEILTKWLAERQEIHINGKLLHTLNWEDMLLFLCEHFYKEAVSARDLNMYKDLLLYKLCDIYYLTMFKKINWEELLIKTKEFELERQVYFTLKYLEDVFNVGSLESVIQVVKPENTNFLNQVYHYNSDKVAYEYKSDILVKRFFDIDKPRKANI
ncbi:nucleotidyltransferase domain-containing protein [Bacillus basilensis]|uniref:nucleotidyltransferase domain-containing protein n=1 Tax=Bacillus basilensis TaxID=3243721 RepID=UPI003D6483AA